MDEMDGIWGEMDEDKNAAFRIFALVFFLKTLVN